MNDWYINLKCRKCSRHSGTIVRGSRDQEKSVGCKNCGLSITISLKDNQRLDVGDLEVNSGIYYPYDS